jgi:3',5'-cyclic AMP phosphodiesterase CpdA
VASGATVLGVIGDWGEDREATRKVIASIARFDGLDAVVTTGDNAYERGTAVEVARSRALLAPITSTGARIVVSLGNHDVATDRGRATREAFGLRSGWYTTTVGPVELVVLDANRTADKAQLAFLRTTLARPRARWRVVVFHQPAYACSFHVADAGVQKRWVSLLAGHVDLVLSGHNHTYERFVGKGGVPYVTTGGGGAQLYPSFANACTGGGRTVVLRTVHHALRMTATSRSLTVEAVTPDDAVFDRLVLTR